MRRLAVPRTLWIILGVLAIIALLIFIIPHINVH